MGGRSGDRIGGGKNPELPRTFRKLQRIITSFAARKNDKICIDMIV